MSALSFARQAFGREKPHSSITDWVDILTGSAIDEEAYDGIPELVDSINLQSAGPAEASRAIRKKLKHGNPHQQYRALVLLKALVENCGNKFQTTFADGQLTDALRHVYSDPTTDRRVKKKLLLVLSSWRDQFKSDPSMSLIAGLYKQCRGEGKRLSEQDLAHLMGLPNPAEDKKKAEKEELKRRAKQEKEERHRREDEERRRRDNGANGPKRVPFQFEKDKPKVLASIVDASQASSNLVNAITLVNLETDSLQENERVQECLAKAKQARKPVVRYIQLVENEELIGTLIETNERVITAMEMYDKLTQMQNPESTADVAAAVTAGLAAAHISMPDGEVSRLQEGQRAAGERVKQATSWRGNDMAQQGDVHLHPDLQDLSFGPLGASSNNLPPPLRPSTLSDDGNGQDDRAYDARGSLSDFSDYDSSDEETHAATMGPSRKRRGGRGYVDVSDDPDDAPFVASRAARAPLVYAKEDDPFADPFADEVAIGASKK